MRDGIIIVGTDGTPASTAAVSWAAREAQRRGRALGIVTVFDWPWESARFGDSSYLDVSREQAEGVAAAAAEQARALAPDLVITSDTRVGHAAPELIGVAGGTDLLVLGSRGRGGFAGLQLGSVSHRVALHAPCSVVVVRGRDDTDSGSVVAGVDDSPTAEHVLRTAFEEASSRGTALDVVQTYLPPMPLWLRNPDPVEVATVEQDAEVRAHLDELVEPWRGKYPDVPVRTLVSHGSPAAVLVGVSHRAQLIVVGHRGHGVLTGSLLGSTGLQLLHHAACPVLIARPDQEVSV